MNTKNMPEVVRVFAVCVTLVIYGVVVVVGASLAFMAVAYTIEFTVDMVAGPCLGSRTLFEECVIHKRDGSIEECTQLVRLRGCNPDGSEYVGANSYD